eukprot:scaffold58197_cov40-Phaeocystis_antarctica.AAC.2
MLTGRIFRAATCQGSWAGTRANGVQRASKGSELARIMPRAPVSDPWTQRVQYCICIKAYFGLLETDPSVADERR